MTYVYKITNCHKKFSYRPFSLTNDLLRLSYTPTNLKKIGDKMTLLFINLIGMPLYPLHPHNRSVQVFVNLFQAGKILLDLRADKFRRGGRERAACG